MAVKKTKKEIPASDETLLPQARIIEAATNSPSLCPDEFQLGDRTFKVLHLEYDEYLAFTGYLQPLLTKISDLVLSRAGVSLPGIDLNSGDASISPSSLMQFCVRDLPEMALLVCNMQSAVEKKPELLVDIPWLKKSARNPFELAKIVMKQMEKNNLVKDFLDFFVQALPTILALKKLQPSPKQ